MYYLLLGSMLHWNYLNEEVTKGGSIWPLFWYFIKELNHFLEVTNTSMEMTL